MITGIGILGPTGTRPVSHLRLWDCGTAWKDLNPAKGVFVWDRLDAMVRMGDCLLVLAGTPRWAAKYPDSTNAAPWLGPGSNSPPRLLTDWDAFVRAVATRYKGRLDYQIGNEPQGVPFWSPWTEVARLAVMTTRAHGIIASIDTHARVVAAPVLPRPSSGGMTRAHRYLTALKAQGWPVDVFAYHAYPEQDEPPARFTWMTNQVKAALREMDAPDLPLWCTEVNYNLTHGPIPLEQVVFFVNATTARAEKADVRRLYWYVYPEHSDPMLLGIPFTPTSLGTQALRAL